MWEQEEIAKAISDISNKAAVDAEFRAKCFSDPIAAVTEVTGKELPADINLRFVSNENASYSVVLPDLIDENAELSDSDLEQVAGGRCGGTCAGGTEAKIICTGCAATCAGATCAGTTASITIGIPGIGCIAGF